MLPIVQPREVREKLAQLQLCGLGATENHLTSWRSLLELIANETQALKWFGYQVLLQYEERLLPENNDNHWQD